MNIANKSFIVKYIFVVVDVDIVENKNFDTNLDKRENFDDVIDFNIIVAQDICFFDVANYANKIRQFISTFDIANKLVKIVDEIEKI